jgi:hypothetical protein
MGSPLLWEALHLPASLLTSGNAYYFSSQLFLFHNRVIIYRGAVFVNVILYCGRLRAKNGCAPLAH